MDKKLERLLAKANGIEEAYNAREIAKNVEDAYSFSDENAIDRKTISAILTALRQNGITIDKATEDEFNYYNEKVEDIKSVVKNVGK